MKKIMFGSLIAFLMLGACKSKNKEKNDSDTMASAMVPPPPPVENVKSDSMAPPLEPPPPPTEDRSDEKTYDFVGMKTPPTYPGGIEKFYEFLGQNIKYPQEAIAKNVQGSVFVSFVVGKDGSVSDVKVDRSLGSGTDAEAVRVLRLSKRWNPGMDKGKAVKATYRIPIKFNLAN